jgi:enolase-phosphatase E1
MIVKAILTDIEGTTSSISFVHDVLFPYAYEAMEDFLAQYGQDEEVKRQILAVCQEENIPECTPQKVASILRQWIREDRKATPLKEIQGMIWGIGYQKGDFRSHIYEDAFKKLSLWKEQKLPIYVYSSGSVKAQKLFFEHSCYGNLLPCFNGFFDTKIGSKKESQSYRLIAESIGLLAEEILFLSDVEMELDAASEVGMQTIWVLRDRVKKTTAKNHTIVNNFTHIAIKNNG